MIRRYHRMRGLFISTFIATVILGGVSSFAVMNQDTDQIYTRPTEITEVICEVTDIKGDTLEIKDMRGETHEVKSDNPKAIEGFRVGDSVHLELKDGKVVSIHK
jgi:hypothetical protein